MTFRSSFRAWVGAVIFSVGLTALAIPKRAPASPSENQAPALAPGVGAPGGPSTSADGLRGRVVEMERRLKDNPRDVAAAVMLADALLRQARASGDARPAGRAATVLETALKEAPGTYDAMRLLGAIDLALHRFARALDVGRQARDMRPSDAWNYGVIGDALLELGDYDNAFAAFARMMDLRPGPAAYARAAYARELTGDLTGAREAMQMAYTATPPQDPEAQAWYATQVGELDLKLGHPREADRAFRHALFAFPNYPLAMVGAAKVKVSEGDQPGALALYLDQFSRTPTLDLAARIGDLLVAAGRPQEAEHYFSLAEQIAGPAQAQTEASLALFLADHDRRLPEAVAIAERVGAERHDIQTDHALAWSYFKIGRLEAANAAMNRALRTGSLDESLRAHAASIFASRPQMASR